MKPTLKFLLNRIEAWAKSHTMITDFGHGEFPDFPQGDKRSDWVKLYIVVQNPDIHPHGIDYNIDFIVFSPTRENPDTKETDMESVKQTLSDMHQIVHDFVSEVRNGDSYFYVNGNQMVFIDAQTVTAFPFIEDHKDVLTGFNAPMKLRVDAPLDACKIPYDDEYVTDPPNTGDCKDVVNTADTPLPDQTPSDPDNYTVDDVVIQYLLRPGIYDGGVNQVPFTIPEQNHASGVPSLGNEAQIVLKLITESALAGGGDAVVDIDIEAALGHGHLLQIVCFSQVLKNTLGDIIGGWEVTPISQPSYTNTISEFLLTFAEQVLPNAKIKGLNYVPGGIPFPPESGALYIPYDPINGYQITKGDLTLLGCLEGYPVTKSMNLFESGAYAETTAPNAWPIERTTAQSIALWHKLGDTVGSGDYVFLMGDKFTGDSSEPGFLWYYFKDTDAIRFFLRSDATNTVQVDFDCAGGFNAYVWNSIILTKSTTSSAASFNMHMNGQLLSRLVINDTLMSGSSAGNGPLAFNRAQDSSFVEHVTFNSFNSKFSRIMLVSKEMDAADREWFEDYDRSGATVCPFLGDVDHNYLFNDDDISGLVVTDSITGTETITVKSATTPFGNTDTP